MRLPQTAEIDFDSQACVFVAKPEAVAAAVDGAAVAVAAAAAAAAAAAELCTLENTPGNSGNSRFTTPRIELLLRLPFLARPPQGEARLLLLTASNWVLVLHKLYQVILQLSDRICVSRRFLRVGTSKYATPCHASHAAAARHA